MFTITSGNNNFDTITLAGNTSITKAIIVAYKKSKKFGTVNILQNNKCIGGFCYGIPR